MHIYLRLSLIVLRLFTQSSQNYGQTKGDNMPRRERNIYKRKDGCYEARFIKERDPNGRAKYGAVYARTYSEVKTKLHQEKSKVNENLTPQQSLQSTIVEDLEAYLNNIRSQVKESTFFLYQRYFEKYISPHFKDVQGQLTLDMSQRLVDEFLESGLSVVTVQSIFSFF